MGQGRPTGSPQSDHAAKTEASGCTGDGRRISISCQRPCKVSEHSSAPFTHRMINTGLAAESTSASDAYSFTYHGYLLTHLDALCHLFHKGKMYNDVSQDQVTEKGAERLAVLNMKGGLF